MFCLKVENTQKIKTWKVFLFPWSWFHDKFLTSVVVVETISNVKEKDKWTKKRKVTTLTKVTLKKKKKKQPKPNPTNKTYKQQQYIFKLL